MGDSIPVSDPSPAALCSIKLQITAGNGHYKKIHLPKKAAPSEGVPQPWSQIPWNKSWVPWKAMTCLCTLVCSFPPNVEASLNGERSSYPIASPLVVATHVTSLSLNV